MAQRCEISQFLIRNIIVLVCLDQHCVVEAELAESFALFVMENFKTVLNNTEVSTRQTAIKKLIGTSNYYVLNRSASDN